MRDARRLLYGRRKRGPGPKAIDQEAHYEERLKRKLKERIAAHRGLEIDEPTVGGCEIIISAFDGDTGVHLIIESRGELRGMINSTFPIYGAVLAYDFDEEDGRHLIDDHISGTVEARSTDEINIGGDPGIKYEVMALMVMREIVCPVFEELAK